MKKYLVTIAVQFEVGSDEPDYDQYTAQDDGLAAFEERFNIDINNWPGAPEVSDYFVDRVELQ